MFIGVSLLLNVDALAGFAMPAMASSFGIPEIVLTMIRYQTPMPMLVIAIGIQKYRYINERRSPCGLRPRRPVGPFGSLFLIFYCRLGIVLGEFYQKVLIRAT